MLTKNPQLIQVGDPFILIKKHGDSLTPPFGLIGIIYFSGIYDFVCKYFSYSSALVTYLTPYHIFIFFSSKWRFKKMLLFFSNKDRKDTVLYKSRVHLFSYSFFAEKMNKPISTGARDLNQIWKRAIIVLLLRAGEPAKNWMFACLLHVFSRMAPGQCNGNGMFVMAQNEVRESPLGWQVGRLCSFFRKYKKDKYKRRRLCKFFPEKKHCMGLHCIGGERTGWSFHVFYIW